MPYEPPSNLPTYPGGIPVAPRTQAKPIIRMVNKMLKPKIRGTKKGFVAGDIKIKHKKVKYW